MHEQLFLLFWDFINLLSSAAKCSVVQKEYLTNWCQVIRLRKRWIYLVLEQCSVRFTIQDEAINCLQYAPLSWRYLLAPIGRCELMTFLVRLTPTRFP